MAENSVKILYCKDDQAKFVYYNDVVKGGRYFCVECDDELIVRDGDVNVKHLAHKSNTICQSTGESVFHNHWKTTMFKAGLNIVVDGIPYEILKVHNEVSLKKFYEKQNWNRDIIVDVLLETSGGDIIVEIRFSNAKSWLETAYLYKELSLLEVFEVEVGKTVNSGLVWHTRKEQLAKELRELERESVNMPSTANCDCNVSDDEIIKALIKSDGTSKFYQDLCVYTMKNGRMSEKQREAAMKQYLRLKESGELYLQ